ncbi:hypothetical protein DFH07DRAFT_237395 [Mycena maculata]|uniref:Uncharacterized protein n=1 Tax=Mycena maculata TaxID=230809 RepID=A0AAD7NQ25_9AGAR|nr:hypothetical protein DFH07DRAFT_237395 [Mycena maculata]
MSPEMYFDDDDEVCPDYNVAVSRSNTATTTSSGATASSSGSSGSNGSSVHWGPPFNDPRSSPPLRSFTSHSQLRRATTQPLRLRPERYVYTYSMLAAGAPLKFLISVEPSNGRPTPGNCTFRLSLKVDGVQRPIGEPIVLRLSVDPRRLDFSVFMFPGKKNVVPAGCMFSMRVWLRVNGVDHRLFGEDELWVGKDLDFSAVTDASCARLRSATADAQVYEAVVGRARVQFIIRWQHLGERLYKYTMEYEAGGVGATLMDDLRLIVEGDPRKLAFHMYSVPMRSIPAGASHRLRVWLKTSAAPVPSDASQLPFVDSFVYQRVWKSDAFKIGARLEFEALGSRLIMGVAEGGGVPQTIVREREEPPTPVGYQQESRGCLI